MFQPNTSAPGRSIQPKLNTMPLNSINYFKAYLTNLSISGRKKNTKLGKMNQNEGEVWSRHQVQGSKSYKVQAENPRTDLGQPHNETTCRKL